MTADELERIWTEWKTDNTHLSDDEFWAAMSFRTAVAQAIATPPASAELSANWLDTILLDYVNLPFGQAEAIECRDRIRAAENRS